MIIRTSTFHILSLCAIVATMCCLAVSLSAQPAGQWNGYGNSAAATASPLTPPLPKLQPNGEVQLAQMIPTVVLLKTDMLLEGKITPQGDGCQVQTEFGCMTIPMANIERLGRDKEDIYQYKQSLTFSGDAQELMKLAEWCLKHGLKEQGIAEYRRARMRAANPSIAQYIDGRIAGITKEEGRPTSSAAGDYAGKAISSDLGAAVDEAVSSIEASEAEGDLALWSSRVPRGVYDSFMKKVQPLLLNRCAAADCHGSQAENDFKLYSIRQHGSSASLRNLRMVLRYVDPDCPEESPLLIMPSQIHGQVKPVLSNQSKQTRGQFETLNSWVLSVTGSAAVQRNQLLARRQPELQPLGPIVQASEPLPLPQRTESPRGVAANEMATGDASPLLKPPSSTTNSSAAIPPTPGNSPASPLIATPLSAGGESSSPVAAARDPFDPEPFNRRYH